MHAAEDDDAGVGLGGFARETERVADEVRDILDLRPLVIGPRGGWADAVRARTASMIESTSRPAETSAVP